MRVDKGAFSFVWLNRGSGWVWDRVKRPAQRRSTSKDFLKSSGVGVGTSDNVIDVRLPNLTKTRQVIIWEQTAVLKRCFEAP